MIARSCAVQVAFFRKVSLAFQKSTSLVFQKSTSLVVFQKSTSLDAGLGSGPAKPTGSLRDRNDAVSRPCMAWAAADIERELNALPVVLWPLIPSPPLRIPDVARLKRCLQTPLFIQNFCFALLYISCVGVEWLFPLRDHFSSRTTIFATSLLACHMLCLEWN